MSTIPSPRPTLILTALSPGANQALHKYFITDSENIAPFEAQTEIASVHGGFAIRRVSTSPLGRYADDIILLMITDTDVEKLKETFVTKEDFADLCIEVGEIQETMNKRFDSLEVKIDNFLGVVDSVQQDNAAGAVMLYRHERHIQALADGTGTTLPGE